MAFSTFSPPPLSVYQELTNRTTLIRSAVLFYDFVLTFPLEVERYWRGQNSFRGASLLVFINRYLSIVLSIPVIYEYFWPMPESVSFLSRFLWLYGLSSNTICPRGKSCSFFLPCISNVSAQVQRNTIVSSNKLVGVSDNSGRWDLNLAAFCIYAKLYLRPILALLFLRTYALYDCSRKVLVLFCGLFIAGATAAGVRQHGRLLLNATTHRISQWAVGSAEPSAVAASEVTEYVGCDLSLSTIQYSQLSYISKYAFADSTVFSIEDIVSSWSMASYSIACLTDFQTWPCRGRRCSFLTQSSSQWLCGRQLITWDLRAVEVLYSMSCLEMVSGWVDVN